MKLFKNKLYLIVMFITFLLTLRVILLWGTGGVHELASNDFYYGVLGFDRFNSFVYTVTLLTYPIWFTVLYVYTKNCKTLIDYVKRIGFIFPIWSLTTFVSMTLLAYISPVKPTFNVYFSDIIWIFADVIVQLIAVIFWIKLLETIKLVRNKTWILILFGTVLFYFLVLLDIAYFGPLMKDLFGVKGAQESIMLNVFGLNTRFELDRFVIISSRLAFRVGLIFLVNWIIRRFKEKQNDQKVERT